MNQNYNFVRGLFTLVSNARNEEFAPKKGTSFKSLLLLVVFALFASISMHGQSLANYTFSTYQNQSLVDMSSGTTQLIGGSNDDAASSVVNIGFPFYFMGTGYSQFSANSNGQMRLGSTAVSGTTQAEAANAPLIVPMSGDNYILSTGKVHYKIIGSSPNQVLVVEWLDLRVPYSTSGVGSVCQALIYQTTGVVEFIYGSVSNNVSPTTTRSIFISSSNTANTVKSVSDGMIAATDGLTPTVITLSDANVALISSTTNTARRMYRFSPALLPASGPTSLVCSGVTSSATILNWTAAVDLTNIYKYVVLNSTNGGISYNVVANIASGTNTYSAAGLTTGTTYTWKVVAISEGLESAPTTATQATVAGATYYWVGTTGGLLSLPANWNTMADGTGTTRAVSATTDILIVDGDGFVAGGATTISVDVASFSIGQLIVNSNTALTLQSSSTTTRTITITGGPGDDFIVDSGSTLSLNNAANAVAFAFLGTGNTGNIAGTVNLTGNASNVITTTGGTGTLVSVTSTGVVNMGNTTISLVGSTATLSFLNGSNCNVSGATTGAPPVPLANWETTSNLTISGITTSTTTAANKTQSFGNFIYNCPLATATMSFFTTATAAVIKGDLIITAAGATGGTGIFRALTTGSLTVNGNVIVTQGRFQSASGAGTLTVLGNTTNSTNGILDINGGNYSQRGTTFTNNGTLTGVATTATLQFYSPTNVAQTLAGTGTVLTNVGVLSIQNTSGLTISHTNQVSILRANLFQGLVTNSNKLTFGTGLALPTTIQIGSAGLLTPGGSLDAAPTFNLGTGTHGIIYAQESVARTTGFEVPSSRSLGFLTVSNSNGLTVSGGALATGTLTFSALTGGNINTSSTNLLTVTGTTTASIVRTSTTAYVNGPLALTLPVSLATGSNYTFPIGKGSLNPFVLVNPMTGATAGATVTVKAEVFDAATGGTPGTLMATLNPSRYWAASITAGASNFTDTLIQLNDTTTGLDAIAASTALTGSYNLVGGVTTTTTATSLTSTTPKATTLPGYFVMGNKASATLTNLAITPTGNACANVLRTVTVTVTPGGGALTSVVINYSKNGTAQTAIAMTNTSGNDWSGVIPTVTPANASIVWSVTATDTNSITKTAIGTPYQDEPTLGVTATATASLATVCATSPSVLSFGVAKPGLVSIGAATTLSGATSQPTAFCNRWSSYRMQTIYTAAELTAAGLNAGNITSMAFNITTLGDGATNANFAVKIGTTSLFAFTDFVPNTGFTSVFPAATFTHVVGLNTITFSTPYNWDGISNIVVEVSHDGANSTNNSITYYTATVGNTVAYSTNGGTTASLSTNRLNTIFSGNSALPPSSYSWSDGTTVVGTTNPLTVNPTAATTTYTGTATIGGCPIVAAPVTITALPLPTAPTAVSTTQCGSIVPLAAVTATSGAAGTGTFKWYAAATGGTALQTSTSATYTTAISTTTTFYVSEVGVNACESVRTPVTITVLTPPTLTLSATPQAICTGTATVTPVTITSTLSDYTSYTWSPSTGVSGTTGSGFTFNPTTTTTYILSASNSVSTCATTASLVVTVNPLPLITSAASSSEPLCLGSSTTLTAVSIPATTGTAAVGAGATTSATYSNPFYSDWSNNHTQHLIKATELSAMGIVAGNITSVALNVTAAGTLPMLDLSVKIGASPATSMTGFAPNSAFQTVFTSASFMPVVGVNTLTFTTPFVWDGTSNLVLEFCHGNAASTATMSRTVSADVTTYVSTVKAQVSGGTSAATICGDTASNLVSYSLRPKFIFGGQVGTNLTSTANWTWSPATALSSTTGNVVTANPTVSTVYTVTAVNPITTCTTSRTVSVTVLPLPSAPTATNATQCGAQLSTAHVTSTTGLTAPIFVWYAAPTGGVALQTGTSSTYTTVISATTTLYVSEYNGTCESVRTPIVLTVTTPPTVTIASSVPSFCGIGGNVVLTASSSDTGMTYSWASLTGSSTISATTGTSVTATLSETSNFMVTGIATDATCLPIEVYKSIGVYALPSATVTTDANGVCPGTSANIASGLSAGNFAVTSIPYAATDAPTVGSSSLMKNGNAIVPLSGGTLDDGGWSGIPIGFNFNYFGTNFSTISAGTNGLLMFGTPSGYGTGAGQLGQFSFTGPTYFPNTANPANIIALIATDMHMGTNTVNASIKYWTEGYAPNRVFVIQYKNVNGYSSNPSATVECRLFETIGVVEIHILEKTFSNNAIIGLQDATQTVGAVAPGRAGGVWTITTPEAWRFTPPANYNTTWTATTVNGTSTLASGVNIFNQTVAPAITTTYSISYTNQTTGCANATGSAQTVMTVLGNVAPTGINTIASATSICTGQTVNFSLDYTGLLDGLVFQWQSFDGTTWSDIASATATTYSTIPTTATQYRCKIVACNGVPGYSSISSIVLANAITSTTPGVRCGTGTAILGATGNTGTTINWYDAITGGNLVGTGSPFTTPSITTTTTYYAGAETINTVSANVGLASDLSTNLSSLSSYGMYLASANNATINSIGIYPSTAGTLNITLKNNSGTTIVSQAFTIDAADISTTVLKTLSLSGFLVPAGSTGWTLNYDLAINRGGGTYAYPSTINGFSITGNTLDGNNITSGTRYYFYNWNVTSLGVCSSIRVPVIATVTTPPTLVLSSNPATICSEQTSTAVTVVTGRSDYDTYAWTPSGTVSGNATNGWVFNPLTTTTYTLAASQSTGATPCATTASVTVTVNPTPTVITIAPTPASVCVDTVLPLVATGGTLPISGIIGSGTSVNTSTTYPAPYTNYYGGTKHQMLIRASELTALGFANGAVISKIAFNVNSVGSTFSGVLNDFQIDMGHTTSSVLSSSSFEGSLVTVLPVSNTPIPTTGLPANVTHTLVTPFVWNGMDNLVIQTSYSNGNSGASTDSVIMTNSDPGFVSTNYYRADSVSSSVILAAGTPSGSGNSRPNMIITASAPTSMAWSPTTNLYSNAAATTPYTGGNASTVYFKSSSAAPAATYTASATSALGCLRTATVPVTVNANTTLALTSANATQTVCTGTAIANIVYTLTAATGVTATLPAGLTGTLVGGTYTISGIPTASGAISVTGTGLCLSSATLTGAITVNPNTTLALLSATATQTVCFGVAISDIVYTVTNGTGVTATLPAGLTGTYLGGAYTISGTPTASGIISVSGTGLCLPSAALTGVITVNLTPAPTASATQTVCYGATIADLAVTGTLAKWYAASTGGTPLATSTALVAGTTYYVSQTLLGCEGVRTAVTVAITTTPAPTGLQFYQFCPSGGATVNDITATLVGTAIKWYTTPSGGVQLASNTPLVQGYYWASQTANGCESPTRFPVFAISNATPAPSSNPLQQFCNSATVANLTANGSGLQWYNVSTGGVALASTTPLATGTYYVSQTSGGCESPRTAVAVNVSVVSAPTGPATQSLSSLLTIGDIVVVGSNVVWYASSANAASGTNPLSPSQLLANTTYYATQTISGCTSTSSLAVTITTLANQDFDMTKFSYYPNPVIDLLNISYSQDMTNVKVFNVIGQQLLSKEVNASTTQIDMSSYPNGAYFIQVATEDAMKTVRVIKK